MDRIAASKIYQGKNYTDAAPYTYFSRNKEYIVMQAEKTVHVPDCLKDEDAISEPLACLLSAAMKLPIETLGDPVAVVGCGYMGLGMISLFRAMGYGKITAIDKRPEALENALRFGATEVFTPDTIPEEYIMTFDTMGKVDLSRDGDNAPLFAMGCPTVMEFTGTQDGLQLAGDLVRAHGRLGIGGYHNDGPRSINYMLWNFKAITTINCHERRISYEARLCQRCIDLLAGGQWNFKGVTRVYDMEEFDRANEEMAAHTNNYIKGAIRCSTYGNGGFLKKYPRIGFPGAAAGAQGSQTALWLSYCAKKLLFGEYSFSSILHISSGLSAQPLEIQSFIIAFSPSQKKV